MAQWKGPGGGTLPGDMKFVPTGTAYSFTKVTTEPLSKGGGHVSQPAKPSLFNYKSKLFADNAASFYGLPIPVSMGRRALIGVPIWSSPRYYDAAGRDYVDFAVSFGYPMVNPGNTKSTQVLKIWADGTLIYDSDTANGWNVGAGIQFKIYNGSESQCVDPTILSWLGANDNIAFRGETYIVFTKFPLGAQGFNFVPLIRVEYRDRYSECVNVKDVVRLDPTTRISPTAVGVDWGRGRITTIASDQRTFHTFDMLNMVEIASVAASVTGVANTWANFLIEPTYGYAIAPYNGISNSQPIGCFDVLTGELLGSFGASTASLTTTATGFAFSRFTFPLRISGSGMTQAMVGSVAVFGNNGTPGVLTVGSDGSLAYAWHLGSVTGTVSSCTGVMTENVIRYCCPGDKISNAEAATAFLASHSDLCRLVVYRGGAGNWVGRLDKIWEPPADHHINFIYLEEVSDDIIVIFRDQTNDESFFSRLQLDSTIKHLITPTVTGTSYCSRLFIGGPIPNPTITEDTINNAYGLSYSEIKPTTSFGYLPGPGTGGANGRIIVLDLTDGSFDNFAFSTWALDGVLQGSPIDIKQTTLWNGSGQYMIGWSTAASGALAFGPAKMYPMVPPTDDIALSFILKHMLIYAGFAANDIYIDPTLNDTFVGAIVVPESELDLWQMLDDMAKALRFEVFESEGKVKITRVGRGTSLNISATLSPSGDDLLAIGGGDDEGKGNNDQQISGSSDPTAGVQQSAYAAFQTTRDWNKDVPSNVELHYLDYTQEYTVNIARAGRTTFPVMVVNNDNVKRLDIPLITSPARAAAYAAGALYELSAGQVQNTLRLGPKFLLFEPADVLALTINSMDYTFKITEATINNDWSLSIQAQSFTNLDSISVTGESSLTTVQSIAGPSISQGFIIDTPPLNPADCSALNDDNLRLYLEVTSYGQPGWLGGVLKTSNNVNGPFSEVMRSTTTGAYVGIAQIALSGALAYTTDLVSQLSVVFPALPAAITAPGYLLVGKPNRWELCYYTNATVSTGSSKVYTFDTLIRGLRGTEWHMRDHAVGDNVLVYPDSGHQLLTVFDNSLLNRTIYYKAVGTNLADSTAQAHAFTMAENFEKPWAPTSLKARTISGGSSGINLSWLRRTRLETVPWGTGGSYPLEPGWTERYEIDIKNSAGTVLRTVTGVTGPSYTYASGDVTTDFGSRPATLSFSVYQISPVVGRGFDGSITTDVLSAT